MSYATQTILNRWKKIKGQKTNKLIHIPKILKKQNYYIKTQKRNKKQDP